MIVSFMKRKEFFAVCNSLKILSDISGCRFSPILELGFATLPPVQLSGGCFIDSRGDRRP